MEASRAEPLEAGATGDAQEWLSDAERPAQMARQHYAFIWRSLRRLGVAEQAVDDATQQVFVLATEKVARIAPGSERGFLFQTAIRIAMSVRRNYAQRREAMEEDQFDEMADPAPLPDVSAELQQQRRFLDQLLDALPMDLRTVFVLFEIERLETAEIASILGIPTGTVASRLRRARETFRLGAERLRKRLESGRKAERGERAGATPNARASAERRTER
jgi:RNA polymerase sigma-70 factor, ECF subfamily